MDVGFNVKYKLVILAIAGPQRNVIKLFEEINVEMEKKIILKVAMMATEHLEMDVINIVLKSLVLDVLLQGTIQLTVFLIKTLMCVVMGYNSPVLVKYAMTETSIMGMVVENNVLLKICIDARVILIQIHGFVNLRGQYSVVIEWCKAGSNVIPLFLMFVVALASFQSAATEKSTRQASSAIAQILQFAIPNVRIRAAEMEK